MNTSMWFELQNAFAQNYQFQEVHIRILWQFTDWRQCDNLKFTRNAIMTVNVAETQVLQFAGDVFWAGLLVQSCVNVSSLTAAYL